MTQDLRDVAWPVRTDRLAIRPATADDLDATWAFRRLPEVGEWLGHDFSDRDVYAERFLDPSRLLSTLVIELDGRAIGDLMLHLEDPWSQSDVADRAHHQQALLGWVLDPAYGGRGYATEAVAEVIRICFAELGLHRVRALCFADNTASWRLMERLGMRREEYAVKDSLHRTRGWLDGMSYALLAEEWRARQVTAARPA